MIDKRVPYLIGFFWGFLLARTFFVTMNQLYLRDLAAEANHTTTKNVLKFVRQINKTGRYPFHVRPQDLILPSFLQNDLQYFLEEGNVAP